MTERKKDMSKVFVNTFLTQHSNNTPPIYTLLLVTGLMSWRQTATRLAQRQSAQRILADVTTGRGILASWVGGVLVLKAKVSDGKVGKRLKPNS